MSFTEPDQPVSPALATPHFGQGTAPQLSVLMGPLGLRAGWGLLLYFLLAIVLAFLFFVGVFELAGQMKPFLQVRHQQQQAQQAAHTQHLPVPRFPLRVKPTFLAEFSEAGAVLAAAFGLSLLERRRFRVYGLEPRLLRDALPGALCGLAAISLLVGLLRALHLLVFDGRLLSGGAVFRYGAAWLLVFLMVGVFEEFFFRGYIQFTLMRGLLGLGARVSPAHAQRAAFWIAALVWSLLFSATHLANAGEDPMGIVMVFVAGILFSYALWRTGSLWWGIGFHVTWDWSQNFLFGVPDSGTVSVGRLFATHPVGHVLLSGGIAGPEGSVLVLPVLALVALVLRLYPQREQPPVEPSALPTIVHGSAAAGIP